jgi:hypothetical protein
VNRFLLCLGFIGALACDDTTAPEPPADVLVVDGDQQIGRINTVLPTALAVRVTRADGSPASNVRVTFSVTDGGGKMSPSAARTDADGDAEAAWQLGPTVGTQRATATVEGLSTTIVFSATATGAPARMAAVSGDLQGGIQGTRLPNSLIVRVTDEGGLAVRDVPVRFAVSTGGGTLTATAANTSAAGDAETSWQLGSSIGTQTVTATVEGLSPIVFTASATGAPARLGAVLGDGQRGIHGTRLPNPIVARVVDESGTPVRGVVVRFEVRSGGGLLTAVAASTDINGNADASWRLGETLGEQTVRASVGTLDPVDFRALATGDPVRLASHAAYDNQSAKAGATILVVVQAFDNAGQLVAGVPVTVEVATGGGSIAPPTSTTNQLGEIAAQWKLGATIGQQTIVARSGSLPAATITATATAP